MAQVAPGGGGPAVPPGQAGSVPRGEVVTPASGLVKPGDFGRAAHTNIEIFVPPPGANPDLPPFETPASVACAYRFVAPASGCDPNIVTTNASGGSHAIAIVDAYHYSAAAGDLTVFASQFSLPAADLHVIYASQGDCVEGGTPPPSGSGTGWDLEAALDIEWAHAMAPAATIYLVEAQSNQYSDMFAAIDVAVKCVQMNGGGQMSLSWGSAEFSGQTAFDSHFNASNVIFFVSAGDAPGPSFPATVPGVISVGGTSFSRDANTHAWQGEFVWKDTGGGPSTIYARPSYQDGIANIVGSSRGTPDLGALADPRTGVWVRNTTYRPGSSGWWFVGGTSLSSPMIAAIANQFGLFFASTDAFLSLIYTLGPSPDYGKYLTDISNGFCGPYNSYVPQLTKSATGLAWDFCTGWGSPHGAN